MAFHDKTSRRDFIKGAAWTALAAAVTAPALSCNAALNSSGSGWNLIDAIAALASSEPLPSALVKRVVRTPDNTYFTYPHSNGFMPDGSFIVASPSSGGLDYISFNPDTGAARLITHLRGVRMYYSISRGGLMLVTQKSGAVVVDMTSTGGKPKQIYAMPDWVVAADSDISADGRTAVLTSNHYVKPEEHRLDLVDIGSGAARTIMRTGWLMDHGHFSPFDPSWVSFCSAVSKRYKRMWLWNERDAPNGRHVFEQIRPDGAKFDIGHERAMFNKPALLVVAFGRENARPRGLYEVGFDGSVRLVSESNRDFHCNVSRDGRWAVVSLQGVYDPSALLPDGDWLNTGPGYGFSDVMVVNMRTGERQFLYRGTNASQKPFQPYEVQPAISPDGRWVLLKDAREQKVLALEIDQQRLGAFLA